MFTSSNENKMKKTVKWIAGIILLLVAAYLIGPKPSKPTFSQTGYNLPASLTELEKEIYTGEMAVKGLKQDNEARIVWSDSAKKEKTKIAILYLHGFSASQEEGNPVHKDVAKILNANLYLSRLEDHGIEIGDSTMIGLTADNYEASAERALAIAKKLGDETIVIGTSGGGALALFLASRHPEIKAIILYSPCVKLYDKTAALLNKPWGLKIGRLASGGTSRIIKPISDADAQYWTMKYRLEGLVALVNFYSNTMKKEVFSKIKCPVFLGYYYKNEIEQDMTASVPSMLKMFDELGTPAELKLKIDFPDAAAHVITSPITTKGWQSVENETLKFLTGIVKI
jgi:esterase/lipase